MPSIKDSFEKINFFYEKWGWWSIDTIIWINQWIIEDVLKKYWPVHLSDINSDITNENFSLVMSTLVENKFKKVVSPKDILFKFSWELEKKLIEKKDYVWYFDIFLNALYAWEIVIASRDTDVEKFIENNNLVENWKRDEWNWIYPVYTSIWLNKTDRYMKRDFKLLSTDRWNCQVANNLTIDSKHTFDAVKKAEVLKLLENLKITDSSEIDRLVWIQWNWINRQFLRILTPKWSTLLNTYNTNASIDDSNPNYTVIKLYAKTDIWKTNQVKLEYLSKPKNCQVKPIFYKQPWLSNYSFSLGQ